MSWASRSVVVAASAWLGCAGTLADPPVSTDDSVEAEDAENDVPDPSEQPKRDVSGAAVVATLRTKDSELTILSAGGGMRYSLIDAHGAEKSLTLDELRAHDANLFEVVKTAMARGGAPLNPSFVDARLEPEVRSAVPGSADRDPALSADRARPAFQRAFSAPGRD